MNSSEIITLVLGIMGAICTIISVVFVIVTSARSKSKDDSTTSAKLAKIETDILYIRQSLDERKNWEHDVDNRLRKVENKIAKDNK